MALHWVFGLEFVVVLLQKMMMRENTGRFLQLRGKLLPFFFLFLFSHWKDSRSGHWKFGTKKWIRLLDSLILTP